MRRLITLSAALSGVASLAPQMIALVALDSRLFGIFSVAYLAFALTTSLLLSLLSDPWVVGGADEMGGGWNSYGRILSTLCFAFGLLSALLTAFFVGWALALLTSVCVMVATYRVGTRYFLVHTKSWKLAVLSDLLAIASTLAAYFGGSVVLDDSLLIVMFAWAAGAFAGACIAGTPRVDVRFTLSWLRVNRATIRPLLVDSLIMDVAAIGTPYMLLPQLGVGGFGLYRAVSNLGAPVRLLVAPLRPVILGSPTRALGWKMTTVVLGSALLSGMGLGATLFFLSGSTLGLGVLSEIGPFWAPAGLYGGAVLLLLYYSLVCRALKSPTFLLVGRVFHTIVGVIGPISGFLVAGVEGAIWGFSSSSFMAACLWMLLAFRARSSE